MLVRMNYLYESLTNEGSALEARSFFSLTAVSVAQVWQYAASFASS